ncbi:MAG TPA: hydrogenase maturation protease [Bacillota bacterium]|nr:hydrogenase maturation protease [Bacillota bacterium]HOK68218.1 hydrogenase maturation protease [Bacillota bacterium]HPP85463.1 hydrogenase maturation protease [Bacillota bacterium]
MKKLIAVGNRFMTDDGIAIAVTEHMRDTMEELGYDVTICETDDKSCFFSLNEDDFIVILDALYTNDTPGSIKTYELSEVLSAPSCCGSQHELSLIELMKLYGRNYKGYLIGIEVADVCYGEEISPVLSQKFENICSAVEDLLAKFNSLIKVE